jgi:hypothetical protein
MEEKSKVLSVTIGSYGNRSIDPTTNSFTARGTAIQRRGDKY